jgi:translation initiation factor 2B subunit (eIF-2B alpha/beta/delta family)
LFSWKAEWNISAEIIDALKKKDDEIKALKETMAKLQPLIDWVDSYPSAEQMKAELGLNKEHDQGDKLHSARTVQEAAAEFENAEVRREVLVRKKGLPMSEEEYKERRRGSGR